MISVLSWANIRLAFMLTVLEKQTYRICPIRRLLHQPNLHRIQGNILLLPYVDLVLLPNLKSIVTAWEKAKRCQVPFGSHALAKICSHTTRSAHYVDRQVS